MEFRPRLIPLLMFLFYLSATSLRADETTRLIAQYCVDCHGSPDESPEAGLSLTAPLNVSPLRETGPTLKRVLDAVEGFEMPPADGDQPTVEERRRLAEGIKQWLAKPSLGYRQSPQV